MPCSLCGGHTRTFTKSENREYVHCTDCEAVLLLPQFYISPEAEKQRYQYHNNDVEDPAYQEFVSPITSGILKDFTPENTGLDYGCGTGPVVASELRKRDFKIALYDLYFKPDEAALQKKYDFVICCEVMEHFHEPAMEFQKLSSLLKPGGKLYCKTSLFSNEMDFESWYYKNDPTHVFFYTKDSLEWIRKNFGFKKLEIQPRLIILSK